MTVDWYLLLSIFFLLPFPFSVTVLFVTIFIFGDDIFLVLLISILSLFAWYDFLAAFLFRAKAYLPISLLNKFPYTIYHFLSLRIELVDASLKVSGGLNKDCCESYWKTSCDTKTGVVLFHYYLKISTSHPKDLDSVPEKYLLGDWSFSNRPKWPFTSSS